MELEKQRKVLEVAKELKKKEEERSLHLQVISSPEDDRPSGSTCDVVTCITAKAEVVRLKVLDWLDLVVFPILVPSPIPPREEDVSIPKPTESVLQTTVESPTPASHEKS